MASRYLPCGNRKISYVKREKLIRRNRVKDQEEQATSIRQKQAYHTAHRCQATAFSLTPLRLCGLKKARQMESEKTKGFFVPHMGASELCRGMSALGSSSSMCKACGFKSSCLIALLFEPHRMDQPKPDVGEGTHSHTVTFPLLALTLIVLQRPGFRLGTLPSKLVQSITKRLDTGMASMNPGIGSALKNHRRGPCQRLQSRRIGVAFPIIANFCQQTRSETFASTGQAREDLAVGV